jgi:hypothetical protein
MRRVSGGMGQSASTELPDPAEWLAFSEVPDVPDHAVRRVSGGLGRRSIRTDTTVVPGVPIVWVIGPARSDVVASPDACRRTQTKPRGKR